MFCRYQAIILPKVLITLNIYDQLAIISVVRITIYFSILYVDAYVYDLGKVVLIYSYIK